VREQVPEGVGGRIRRVHVHEGRGRRGGGEGAGDAGAGTAGNRRRERRRCPPRGSWEAEEGGREGE
jgi:hypothetical protein